MHGPCHASTRTFSRDLFHEQHNPKLPHCSDRSDRGYFIRCCGRGVLAGWAGARNRALISTRDKTRRIGNILGSDEGITSVGGGRADGASRCGAVTLRRKVDEAKLVDAYKTMESNLQFAVRPTACACSEGLTRVRPRARARRPTQGAVRSIDASAGRPMATRP